MKCNDCIYEKMCESRYEREHCLSFKDKANFVEVVRCKDCKHFKDKGADGQYCQYHTKNAGENCDGAFWVAKNDYCSDGERREE